MSELRFIIDTAEKIIASALKENNLTTQVTSLVENAGKFKINVPDTLNFIWIGDPAKADLSYLPVWQRFNPRAALQLWTDDSSSLCVHFHLCLKNRVLNNPQLSLRELQNEAFNFIYPRVVRGQTFNAAAIDYLQVSGAGDETEIDSPGFQQSSYYLPEGVKKRDIQSLLSHDLSVYRKYYYYEIILRGNLAAASDIIRLMILSRYGGTYIDIDTLPYVSDIFHYTSEVERQLSLENDERVCLAKSAAFMAWFEEQSDITVHSRAFIDNISQLTDVNRQLILSSIRSDILGMDFDKIKPMSNSIKVHPDLMLIGATDFLPGVYYNNLLCSAPASKLVRMVLHNIAKRYTFLEKNGAVFCTDTYGESLRQSEILTGYRSHDSYLSSPVTRWLTGPGVIIDTVIQLVYRLMPASTVHRPEILGEILHRDEFGLTLKLQTLDTPMGLK
ncbi:hypothetical protein RM392_002409 [Enterobacter cloacae]|uniref:TcdA/TcdB catalytic glycosyltransferase domain-containing protein n=1 Tax=Enterobacter cloacae TaxID=550 RepID=UPI0020035E69|nr:TcdA/TcdB catalytic glycosyltransferase domain-containing protein [Enterobacter cloacae]ELE9705226.1 hypothetical protein [Enterobacter cloacae]MCK7318111.1 hypothetical protein [Enterobacter cloacae]